MSRILTSILLLLALLSPLQALTITTLDVSIPTTTSSIAIGTAQVEWLLTLDVNTGSGAIQPRTVYLTAPVAWTFSYTSGGTQYPVNATSLMRIDLAAASTTFFVTGASSSTLSLYATPIGSQTSGGVVTGTTIDASVIGGSSPAAGTFTAVTANTGSVKAADGLTLGTDVAGGTTNIPGYLKMWSNGDNAFFSSFVTPTQTASAAYTLPTAPATVAGSMLVDAAANGMLSWTASPTVANLTDSALTPTYVPVAGTAGLLGNSNLSVDTSVTTCSVLNFGATTVDPTSINGDLWLNTATWKYQSGGTVKTLAVNQGVVDASTAAAGIVGECLTANVTAQALGGTGAAGNIVTLNLTAGDWIIEGSATLFGGTTGFTAASLVSLSLNTTTATQNTNTFMVSSDSIQALVASGYKGMRAPKMHLSVNATTPVYLVATASYVAGSPTAAAQVVATRIR